MLGMCQKWFYHVLFVAISTCVLQKSLLTKCCKYFYLMLNHNGTLPFESQHSFSVKKIKGTIVQPGVVCSSLTILRRKSSCFSLVRPQRCLWPAFLIILWPNLHIFKDLCVIQGHSRSSDGMERIMKLPWIPWSVPLIMESKVLGFINFIFL